MINLKPILQLFDLSDFDLDNIEKYNKQTLMDLLDSRPLSIKDYSSCKTNAVITCNNKLDKNSYIKILKNSYDNYVILFKYHEKILNYKNIPAKIVVSSGEIIRIVYKSESGITDFNGQPAIQSKQKYHINGLEPQVYCEKALFPCYECSYYLNDQLHRIDGKATLREYWLFGKRIKSEKKYWRLINSVQTSSKKLLKLNLSNIELKLIYELALYFENKDYANQIEDLMLINKLIKNNSKGGILINM